ncbi:MAG: hypothetical protein EBW40_05085 [Gammaproteobacteria bacterium]|nr:hypothetical protein [Gammaproteobacteria bacterium]
MDRDVASRLGKLVFLRTSIHQPRQLRLQYRPLHHLARAQILQEASVAMLAQANSAAQTVLKLLQ